MCLEFKIYTHTGRSFSPTSQFSVVVGLCFFCFGFVFCFCFCFFATQHEVCGILVAHPGMEPEPPAEEVWGPNPGPSGKSLLVLWRFCPLLGRLPLFWVSCGLFQCLYKTQWNRNTSSYFHIFSRKKFSSVQFSSVAQSILWSRRRLNPRNILPFSLKTVILGNLPFR